MATTQQPGKAYGFFNCKASQKEIEAELSRSRKYARTPPQLELSLLEGVDIVKGDLYLMALVESAEEERLNFAIEATYPGATNAEAAGELATILTKIAQSSLYTKKERFRRKVAYKENGNYVVTE